MLWEKFKWAWVTAWKFKRTRYPRTKWGARLCLSSVGSWFLSIGVLKVKFESGYIVDALSLSAEEISLYTVLISLVLMVIGISLIYSEWNIKARHTAKVLISSIPGVTADFPDEILDPTEKEFCREPVILGTPEDLQENIEHQIKILNAELEADIFKRFILQDNSQRLYFGGLARIPILVAYGALIRNISGSILYFDKLHHGGSWSLLDEENKLISIGEPSLPYSVNSEGNIGLAVSFSTEIRKYQLPEQLREHTTFIYSKTKFERNLIKNQDNLHQISTKIGQLIDQLSAMPDCKQVHLFLSIQSALAIEIGRKFQDGVHKNWVIHNYCPEASTYNWAIELTKNGISKYLQKLGAG